MDKSNLFVLEENVIGIPFLVKGKLIQPPSIKYQDLKEAFEGTDIGADYLKINEAQVIREPITGNQTTECTDGYIYQVMPIIKAEDLIENDIDNLVKTLYSLSVAEILDYLDNIGNYLCKNKNLLSQAAKIYGLTAKYPDNIINAQLSAISKTLNGKTAKDIIDAELSYNGKPGSAFLNGWVKVNNKGVAVRAMPTRQLHITAGNAFEVPIISALRAVLTKSAAVIKMPREALISGALLAVAAYNTAPNHPITQNMSLVYWRGGDYEIEKDLFKPKAFDRIIVWGGANAVTAIQNQNPFVRVISFNPKYGISLIGKKCFSANLKETVAKALKDVLINNQNSCNASLVHYVEGTKEQVNEYALLIQQGLKNYDRIAPNFVIPDAAGQIKRMKRGKYAGEKWYLNYTNENYVSGATVINGEFDILDHPLSRLVVIRPVDKAEDALKYIHQSVSTVGIFPEKLRLELKEQILGRGASTVLPLGQCDTVFGGMPHDGMIVLSQLVDWKTG
ncbi:MAG: acyl-CoA reductase [Dehalococcoidales bacterium]